MVTINNFGWRLANQMFMIAAGYTLAKRNNTEFLCPEWKYQKYFKIKHKVYNGEPIHHFYSEKGFNYNPIPFKDNMAISGYFQSEKYFDREEVKALFELEDNYRYKFSPYKKCSIHVRRGDYLNYPEHHPVLTVEYYKKAIKEVLDRSNGLIDFLICSDDIEWCKKVFIPEHFEGIEFLFSDGTLEMIDLSYMINSDHNIIANSTFSWWAAMLNNNPNKIVVSPNKNKWHGPAYKDWNHDDIIPSDWVQIEF